MDNFCRKMQFRTRSRGLRAHFDNVRNNQTEKHQIPTVALHVSPPARPPCGGDEHLACSADSEEDWESHLAALTGADTIVVP